MTTENKKRFAVITNSDIDINTTSEHQKTPPKESFHSNPMYEKLLNFRNLQEQQKKKFSVDDLFKLC